MNFGLDYDGTYNSDPELWKNFIRDAYSRGHKVWVVTMRFPSEVYNPGPGYDKIPQDLIDLVEGVIPTSRKAKAPFLDVLQLKMNVIIDDTPHAWYMDAQHIWGPLAPEGQAVEIKYD